MPEFLEKKLRKQYGDNPRAIYGTMNAIGAMHGNKTTPKGKEMERKHKASKKTTGKKRKSTSKRQVPKRGHEKKAFLRNLQDENEGHDKEKEA